jgi:hypothetical protein
MAVTKIGYAAIRKDTYEGKEFIDSSSITCTPELVGVDIEQTKRCIPGWHNANPVQRIARVKIEELE